MNYKVSWWRTSFGEEEIQRIADSIRNEFVSQGEVTKQFEQAMSDFLEVEHAIAVSSGSTAILMALMAVGVLPGDEVIMPNRTWIATAHAVHLLGAKVVLIDVGNKRPLIDADQIEQHITAKTKVIMPVHMNGRSADMLKIHEIAKRHSLFVIEDAAQAIASRNQNGYLGTQSAIGCFSLSVAKTISTGQGGFAVTNNDKLANRMRAIRTHGVENVKDPEKWGIPGFNFRFTDVLASIGIEQLNRLPDRIDHLKIIYKTYADKLKDTRFKLIPVNLELGEVPLYNEFLVENRNKWIKRLENKQIETRPFYPDLDKAPYFKQKKINYPNSRKYGLMGIYLPSGPDQSITNINKCIEIIRNYC